jgi:hypothetical protein
MPIGYQKLNRFDPEDLATLWDEFRDQVDFTQELDPEDINCLIKYNGDLVTPGSIKTNTHRLVSDIGYISHQIWKEKTTPQLVNLHQVDIDMVMESLERIAELLGSDLIECLQIAYDEIAKRKGQMINGIFVKAGDE